MKSLQNETKIDKENIVKPTDFCEWLSVCVYVLFTNPLNNTQQVFLQSCTPLRQIRTERNVLLGFLNLASRIIFY